MIHVENIHLTYGKGTPTEVEALRGVDLHVPEGQFTTVIGSNGAGKSSLLHVLAGDVLPSVGQIYLGEKNVTTKPTEKRAESIARVFQDPLKGSCAGLTIEENMALAYKRGGMRGLVPAIRKQRRQYFQEKLQMLGLGLENRLGDQVGLLSGGQRQALSLLMATLGPTEVLLLDEHTAALDPKTATFVIELTCKIIDENRLTAMMVTHSMQQALDVGVRTIMLHEGRIVFDVAHNDRSDLKVADLLALFEESCGQTLADDSLLLSA